MSDNLSNILKKTNSELFDIFTAKQEYDCKKDKHGRFLYSLSKQNLFSIFNPVVSEWIIMNNLLVFEWPDKHSAAACLTHDIDRIHPTNRYKIRSILKSIVKRNAINGSKNILNKLRYYYINPFWNFKEIIELEEKYGAKSSFYFKTNVMDPDNALYDISECKDVLSYISNRGWEVGLHGGYYSYNKSEKLKEEKKKLERVLTKNVTGLRMHYLMFDVPDTWHILSDLGFKYDTTYGYPDMIGFRNGMCHPFKPYDLKRKKEIDILEIPLNIMDTCLFSYMKLQPIDALYSIKKMIDIIEEKKGVLTILWHNSTFDEMFYGEYANLYEKILKYLYEKNFWMTCAEDIYQYWMKNVI